MRYTAPILAAMAATASATAPLTERTTMYTLELAADKVVEVTEEEKFKMMDAGKHFFDITEFKDSKPAAQRKAALPFPTEFNHKCGVQELIKKIDLDTIKTDLEKFSSFHNRYYMSQHGVDSTEWLYEKLRGIISYSGHSLANVRYVRHNAWSQPSIIVTIPGTTQNTVVIGSHLDSVISGDRGGGRAPGADDNGSGSMLIMEILRHYLQDERVNDSIRNTVEFHWYAAEEAGLLGSQQIFTEYAASGRQVVSMLNQDMVGFAARDGNPRFGLITDFTDPDMREYMKLVIDEFADIPYEEAECGYACSDHASATRQNYPSVFLFEAPFGQHNPHIHTPNDTLEHVNFDQVMEHAKVSSAYLYELSFWEFA